MNTFRWVIVVYYKCQFSNFSAISWQEQVNFQWHDDEVCFVLDQHAELDFYSASSLKQQSAGRHVAPLGHINAVYLAEKQQIPILKSLGWPDRDSNSGSIIQASMVTIMPPMQLHPFVKYTNILLNKGNAKRGVSPHLKIWPGDLGNQ